VGEQDDEGVELEGVGVADGDGRDGDELLLVEDGAVEFLEVAEGGEQLQHGLCHALAGRELRELEQNVRACLGDHNKVGGRFRKLNGRFLGDLFAENFDGQMKHKMLHLARFFFLLEHFFFF
jgi:hypothetical protein